MSQIETPKKQTAARGLDFAKRLEQSIYAHPQAPDTHGRQKWVRERMESRFNLVVSPEAVRKWFHGEARPRPQIMTKLAEVLEVDESWLALGLKPNSTPEQRRHHNAVAGGAINLVAGMIQMNGGMIAFPDADTETVDLYAIIGGKQHNVVVVTPVVQGSQRRVVLPVQHQRCIVMLVLQKGPTVFSIARLHSELIEKGEKKGGYIELDVTADEDLPLIVSFSNLDGERQLRRRA